MLANAVGTYAGLIWNALNGKEGLNQKEIKKISKLKDKEFYMGLGWLLREDKVNAVEVAEDIIYSLK
mgnify:CR=1 FL=1